MTNRYIDCFVDLVDVLELVFEVEQLWLFGNFHWGDLHDVANGVVLELFLDFGIAVFALRCLELEFHVGFLGFY